MLLKIKIKIKLILLIFQGVVFYFIVFCLAKRCAFNFFLKRLRVEASRISTGVSFHNFSAEYLIFSAEYLIFSAEYLIFSVEYLIVECNIK